VGLAVCGRVVEDVCGYGAGVEFGAIVIVMESRGRLLLVAIYR